jgi:hypothetical protein
MRLPAKTEKTTGYVMLTAGLILVIVPALTALWMFFSGAQIPQFIPIPLEETSENLDSVIVFSNVVALFLIFIIIIWAGSIFSSRGVTLIKDVKLKMVGKNLREAADLAEKVKGDD